MGAALFVAFILLPAALILAAGLGLPRLLEGRRQKAYAEFCLSRGYQYVPQRKDATVPFVDLVGMFKDGASHTWRDEISGQLKFHPFTAFEYQYVTGAGRSRMVFNRAVIHWRLDGTALPRFTLVPASTYLFRIGRDANGVDFPDDSAFAREYLLTGEDQAAIRSVFTPQLRATMTAMKGQFVTGRGPDVFWWQERRLPSANGFDAFLNEGAQVVELFAPSWHALDVAADLFPELPDVDDRRLHAKACQGGADLAAVIGPVVERLGEPNAHSGS